MIGLCHLVHYNPSVRSNGQINENNSRKVAVLGLGYVGLPLSIKIASKGFKVFGLDTSKERVKRIQSLDLNFEDVNFKQLRELMQNGQLNVSYEFNEIANAETVIICVPTPLNSSNGPNLSFLLQAINEISKYVRPGTLISLESTSYPGTTEDLLKPTLLKSAGLSEGDLYFAFSPERVDPRNPKWNLENTPKVVSGISEVDSRRALDFYGKIFSNVVSSSSTKAAEMAKLLENSFRLVNISLINEVAQICKLSNIEVSEVIRLAATKPFGFMPFFPGPGIGGHCIPVDPVYLQFKANELGFTSKLIEAALIQNQGMPERILTRCQEIIAQLEAKPIIGVIGLAYKPNISDTRESSSVKFIEVARARGFEVYWHDEIVGNWAGEQSLSLDKIFEVTNINLFMVNHDYLLNFHSSTNKNILDCTYTLELNDKIQYL